MSDLKEVLHTEKVHIIAGPDGGLPRSSDGLLDVRLTIPGTPGRGTNPEQLFAAGWSAGFFNTLGWVAQKNGDHPAGRLAAWSTSRRGKVENNVQK